MLSRPIAGRQPKTVPALAAEATSRAGSPARRGPAAILISCPVTRRAVAIISLTEKPHPLPRLQISLAPPRRQIVNGAQMSVGQIHDVQIIADTGAVRRGVILAENSDLLAPAQGNLQDQGD